MLNMNNRLALVVGASSGLGAAIAHQLRRDGFGVIGTSRRAVPNTPIDVHADQLQCLDVRDDQSVQSLTAHLRAHQLVPDVVILNAGYGISGSVEETPTSLAEAQFATNFFGLHRVVQAFLPPMRERGSGQLIFIGSIARQLPLPFQSFYSASKAALAAYADALRMEVMVHGLTVSTIEPGDHQTGFAVGRDSSLITTNSPYQPQAARAIELYEKSERGGAPAASLAAFVSRVATARHPTSRYQVCSKQERFALMMRAMLPARLFERFMMSIFEIPRNKRVR